jgi:hypothetical protein
VLATLFLETLKTISTWLQVIAYAENLQLKKASAKYRHNRGILREAGKMVHKIESKFGSRPKIYGF